MTTFKNLDNSAKFFLQAFQQQNGVIGNNVEQKITEACEAKGAPLNSQELEKAMLAAMPAAKAQIADISKASAKSSYHPDGCKANFVTQQIGLMIEKERNNAVQPRRNRPARQTWGRDPLYAKFVMDNDANSILLFNGRDVDKNGKPLLMKAVLRVTNPEDKELTNKEIGQFMEKMGQFENLRTTWKSPDIQVVPRDATYVETKDVQETEFNFGDPLLHVSLDHTGKELSRGVKTDPENRLIDKFYSANQDGTPNLRAYMGEARDRVTVGDQLDSTRAHVFDERVQLSMQLKEGQELGCDWLDTDASVMDIKLRTEPGLIFEPGKSAKVTFHNANLEVGVDKDDAFFAGSPGQETAVNAPNVTLRHLLTRDKIRRQVTDLHRNAADRDNRNQSPSNYIFADAGNYSLGGFAFEPLTDQKVFKKQFAERGIEATMVPRKGDQEQNGTTISIKLNAGFLKSENGSSVEGWSVAAGVDDPIDGWQQAKIQTCDNKEQSGVMKFTLSTDDIGAVMQHGRDIELRVFNQNGVPAQRLQIPAAAIPWNDKVLP